MIVLTRFIIHLVTTTFKWEIQDQFLGISPNRLEKCGKSEKQVSNSEKNRFSRLRCSSFPNTEC